MKKKVFLCIALFILSCPFQRALADTQAQETFGAGSLIIPMDSFYQKDDDGGILEAYGLVYYLLKHTDSAGEHDIAVYWVIDESKTTIEDDDLVIEYNFAWYAYDEGVSDAWERTRAAAKLRHMIIDAQWYTMSEAYIFSSVDPMTLVLWQHAPDKGQLVLGIGRVDYPGGEEQRVWLKQATHEHDTWPNTVVGQFLVDFQVTA